MLKLIRLAGLFACLWLVLIQTDVDGTLLMTGWHGLIVVYGILAVIVGLELGEWMEQRA